MLTIASFMLIYRFKLYGVHLGINHHPLYFILSDNENDIMLIDGADSIFARLARRGSSDTNQIPAMGEPASELWRGPGTFVENSAVTLTSSGTSLTCGTLA